MKVGIIDKSGKKVADYDFKLAEDIRTDIFKRAVEAETSLFRQRDGAKPEAGKRHSISVSKRRQTFRSTYGKGGSRTPKKTMWRRGMQLRFVGAFASNTVGGRKPTAPKADKNWTKNMNNKEWLKALRVGIMASFDNKIVSENGQKVPQSYPMIVDSSVEEIAKTKDFEKFLATAGFQEEMDRTANRTIRAGKGTMRNRTYKTKRGPLFVVSTIEKPMLKAARNIKGFDIVTADMLMVSDFGMSYKPGRAVIFSKDAIEEFMEVFN